MLLRCPYRSSKGIASVMTAIFMSNDYFEANRLHPRVDFGLIRLVASTTLKTMRHELMHMAKENRSISWTGCTYISFGCRWLRVRRVIFTSARMRFVRKTITAAEPGASDSIVMRLALGPCYEWVKVNRVSLSLAVMMTELLMAYTAF